MSYDKTKTDPALGQKVHKHLASIGVETPIIDNGLSRREKIDKIETHFDEIVTTLGLDLKDDSLMIHQNVLLKCMSMKYFGGLITMLFPR
jgi:GTP cyclohydrolase I